jgi:hypothetical protein
VSADQIKAYTLRQLEAEFLTYHVDADATRWTQVTSIEQAQGVRFLCPKCFHKNGGNVGTHSVICWSRSRGVPETATPGPGRWSLHGTSLDDLTLHGDPPGGARSILLSGDCAWHGYVNNGEATLA